MTSVVVTPLVPPFTGPVVMIGFRDEEKVLALSEEDGALVAALIADPIGREVVMEKVGDQIRISVAQ